MSTLTVIDDKNMRGLIAPSGMLPREVLEDMIDLVELSTPAVAKKTAARLRAKRWTPLSKVPRKR